MRKLVDTTTILNIIMSWILALTIPCRDDGAFLITNAHVLLELFTSVDEFQKRGYENQKERLLSSLQKRLFPEENNFWIYQGNQCHSQNKIIFLVLIITGMKIVVLLVPLKDPLMKM